MLTLDPVAFGQLDLEGIFFCDYPKDLVVFVVSHVIRLSKSSYGLNKASPTTWHAHLTACHKSPAFEQCIGIMLMKL